MNRIVIRQGKPEDAYHFVELDLISAPEYLPYVLGSKVRDILRNMFLDKANWFSHRHTYFVEVDNQTAGMGLAYSYEHKKEEEPHTGELMVKWLEGSVFTELPDPRNFEIVGLIEEADYYINDMGVYAKFRGLGLGTRLFERIERSARKMGSKRTVLDVETDNTRAIELYERLGYRIESRSFIIEAKVKSFEFFKMVKAI